MTTTHLERSVLVTAILDTGEEKNLIITSICEGYNLKSIIKVHQEGFVSVHVSSISRSEIKMIGTQIDKTHEKEVDLNLFWDYKPRELDYFSGHENQ